MHGTVNIKFTVCGCSGISSERGQEAVQKRGYGCLVSRKRAVYGRSVRITYIADSIRKSLCFVLQ